MKTSLILEKRRRFALILAAALCCVAPSLVAADGTWLNTGATSANWSESTNWASGTVPGATSGTTNLDTATFEVAVGTFGTSANPILIDTYRNIYNINFSTNAGSFTIGTTGGNALYLTSNSTNATIMLNSGLTSGSLVTETINAPIVMGGSVVFRNNSNSGTGSGSGVMNFGGNISGGASSAMTLTLRGTNTNANTVSGAISNGSSSVIGLNKVDTGSWVLSGSNSFTGDVNILAGTLSVNSIANSGSSSALGAGSKINLGQNNASQGVGTLLYTGSTASSNRAIRISNGSNGGGGIISVATAGQTLTLSGDITTAAAASASVLTVTGNGNGVLSGNITGSPALTLRKQGAGIWKVSGSNTYTSATEVTAGTLLVNGDNSAATGAVSVSNTGSVLGGDGTVGGAATLAAGTKLSPGSDSGLAGNLTFTNGLNISAASNNTGAYLFNLGALAASDKVTITSGTLNVGVLDAADFSFTTSAGFGNGTYILFDASSTITGTIGSAAVVFGGGVTGTLSLDSVNNNVLITVIPEPSVCLLAGLGAGVVLWSTRRRRVAA